MPFDPWSIIDRGALRVLRDHVASTTEREVGGFLLGHHGEAHEAPRCIAAVEAHDAIGDLTSLRFTHDAWDQVYRVQEDQYPDSTIIGWYHSHPGHGIFLSGYDQFIQRNFFPAPWQIAIVVDPVKQTEGLFAWARGELKLLSERPQASRFAPATYAGATAFTRRDDVIRPPRKRLVVSFDDDTPDAAELEPSREPTEEVPRRERILVSTAPPPSADEAIEPPRIPSSYPVAGHLVPVAAGFLTGVAAALAAGI